MDGKLVRLRAYEKSDLDAVMKWVNDEEVTDLLGGAMLTYPVSSSAEEKFIEAAAGSSEKQKNFVIETLADRRYIGTISFNVIDWLNRSAGLGIVIGDKSLWGKGYGTDAARLRQDEPASPMAARSRIQPARDRVVRKIHARRSAAPGAFQARLLSRHDRDGDSRKRVSRHRVARMTTGRFPLGSRFAARSSRCC